MNLFGLLFLALLVLGLLALLPLFYLPWWGSLIYLLVLGYAVRRGVPALLKQAFMLPFRLKGGALRGAGAVVERVQAAWPPTSDQAGPAEERNWDWYSVELRVVPAGSTSTPFKLWEPGELVLAPAGTKRVGADDEPLGRVATVELWHDDAWHTDEGEKYPGEQRLKLLVGVPADTRAARLRYYFEVFGDLAFPGVLETSAS